MGPEFFVDTKPCMARSGRETHGAMRQPCSTRKTIKPGTVLEPRWCPPGLTRMQRRWVQKLRAKEIQEKEQEAERDHWFNQERPMKESAKMWKVKRIEKEEKGEDSEDDSEP
jgi:hypothetical protein